MGVQFNGKSPSKLWYVAQTTKAMMMTPFNHTTRKDAGRLGKNAAIITGSLIAANFLMGVPLIGGTILSWVVGGAAITATFHFGRKGWEQFKGLKETAFVSNYVREQENKWYERKKNGNVFTRALNSVKEKFAKIPAAVKQVAKWGGLATAVAALGAGAAGALGHFGVVPALAPFAEAVIGIGVAAGLTATVAAGVALGAAVVAIPVGLGVFRAASKSLDAANPGSKPGFFKRPAPDGKPISEGTVFTGEAKSFDFNDNAAPKKDDALAKQRAAAAEARNKNKQRRDNSNKF